VARNWRCRAGEIDLIARRGRVVVFCEVKTRSSGAFGTPAEAVTVPKRARVRRLAGRWLAEQPAGRGGHIRFDVAAVLGDRVEILEAVF
jgi:putative endonuclease